MCRKELERSLVNLVDRMNGGIDIQIVEDAFDAVRQKIVHTLLAAQEDNKWRTIFVIPLFQAVICASSSPWLIKLCVAFQICSDVMNSSIKNCLIPISTEMTHVIGRLSSVAESVAHDLGARFRTLNFKHEHLPSCDGNNELLKLLDCSGGNSNCNNKSCCL